MSSEVDNLNFPPPPEELLLSPDTTEFIQFERQFEMDEAISSEDAREVSTESLNGDHHHQRADDSDGRVSFRKVEVSATDDDDDEIIEEALDGFETNSSGVHGQQEIKKEFQSELEHILEERKKSCSAESAEASLQLMERRQLRQFSRADEYLYAMKEDLAEWFNMLYPGIDIDAECFMDKLETGEHLIKVGQIIFTLYFWPHCDLAENTTE